MAKHVPGLVAALDVLETEKKRLDQEALRHDVGMSAAILNVPSAAKVLVDAVPALVKLARAQVAFRAATTFDERGPYLALMDEALAEIPVVVLGPDVDEALIDAWQRGCQWGRTPSEVPSE